MKSAVLQNDFAGAGLSRTLKSPSSASASSIDRNWRKGRLINSGRGTRAPRRKRATIAAGPIDDHASRMHESVKSSGFVEWGHHARWGPGGEVMVADKTKPPTFATRFEEGSDRVRTAGISPFALTSAAIGANLPGTHSPPPSSARRIRNIVGR